MGLRITYLQRPCRILELSSILLCCFYKARLLFIFIYFSYVLFGCEALAGFRKDDFVPSQFQSFFYIYFLVCRLFLAVLLLFSFRLHFSFPISSVDVNFAREFPWFRTILLACCKGWRRSDRMRNDVLCSVGSFLVLLSFLFLWPLFLFLFFYALCVSERERDWTWYVLYFIPFGYLVLCMYVCMYMLLCRFKVARKEGCRGGWVKEWRSLVELHQSSDKQDMTWFKGLYLPTCIPSLPLGRMVWMFENLRIPPTLPLQWDFAPW